LFSVFCAAAAIFVFDKLLKRFEIENSSWLFFFAVNPFLLYAALEIRVYALVILLTGVLLETWFDGFALENRSSQFWYFPLAVAAVYTNYYLGFLLAALAFALVVGRNWRGLKNYVLQMTAALILIAPIAFIIKQQFAVNGDYFRETPTVVEGSKIIYNLVADFVLPAPNELGAIRFWILRGGAILFLIFLIRIAFVKKIFKPGANFSRSKIAALAVICFVLAAFFFAAYFLLGAEYIQMRHAAPLFVPLMLLVFAVSEKILSARGLTVIFVLLAFFYATDIFENYAPLAKRGDWRRVAAFIQANESPNEPIVIFRVYDRLPFGFYYRGANQIIPSEDFPSGWNAEAAAETPERWRRQIEFLTNQIPSDARQIWLVTEDRCDDAKTKIECRPLEDFVQSNYTVTRDAIFYTRRVRLLKK
jgi:hypothetical protein